MSQYAAARDSSSLSRTNARAWNWAHSRASKLGVKLVIQADRMPRGRRRSGDVAVFAAGSQQPGFFGISQILGALPGIDLKDVLYLDDGAPEELTRAIKRRGWSKVHDNQKTGFWYGPSDAIPATPPSWLPTGAVVPPSPAHGLEELRGCHLVLVEVAGWWFPLRYDAIWTWEPTAGIARGEKWRFVPAPTPGAPWLTGIIEVGEFVYVGTGIAKSEYSMPDRVLGDGDVFVSVKTTEST